MTETKICQNCKKEFIIEPEDFEFYKKIQVPPPTWCPECRLIRRMIWRNEWRVYKRKEQLTNKEIFSSFSEASPVKVYSPEYWWSDAWDAISYGRDYDFKKAFFQQIAELLQQVPLPAGTRINVINCEYCMNLGWSKDCYLTFAGEYGERLNYVIYFAHSRDSFDSHMLFNSELCYEGVNLHKCYKTFFSVDCEDCQDVFFCKDCIGCSNCFGCVNLRNASYYIFNKPYSTKEYFRKIKQFDLGSFSILNKLRDKVIAFWLKFPRKFIHGRKNVKVSGDYIYHSKNAVACYRVNDAEGIKYCQNVLGATKDCYDYTNWGHGAELIYESLMCGDQIYNVKFSFRSHSGNRNLQYCIFCINSSDLLGCIGLRHKQYCILNKQYTKEEYERLVPKIIEHMNKMPYIDKKGRVYKYGEFFPPELSPFSYNETIAQEYFPLTKEKALEKGYKWKDEEQRYYKPDLKTEDLPDHIKDVKDDILGKIIQCAHAKLNKDGILKATCNENCTTAFKIIEPELQFYRKMNLPLPRLCPNCRHFQRIKQRNSLKLWKRKCMCQGETSINGLYKNQAEHFHKENPCPNEFETSYSPNRQEIVYCEACYSAETA